MAWVQVGPHKINTAMVCYVEQEDQTVRVYFTGEWEGNPLDLHFDEAKAFWKHLKAEDVLIGRDKGSATVMPKVGSASNVSSASSTAATSMYDLNVDGKPADDKPKPSANFGTASGAKPAHPPDPKHADRYKQLAKNK